ncbi:N-acetylmuramoyl-L-alanine amidase [Clostridioides difficile]|uniref:N-acetylmuramoyl-L-alanine amidase n=5 Tax=Clostridioides difficile TaxID=1496 RepID=UPI00038D8881|nr:N-acetylmuramoyl-L-alanine amidase [Clostridioides difficile]ALP03680.1 N-acetylmuramoyl-L-alanine amidase LytC precursor [Clostridioides difficile]EGT4674166.1 N-acetylmuramoyl-L-alanine amidase [Clostridioides difficile]EQJ82907.1 N-acetylmuramoyl-L-alanine amidase family protein [Clostridioides difficile P46]ERM52034.1 N-acetylmuramoyl-L-alanine amidase family protein [Clostridioides difficile P68]MBF9962813.1 N-acetylmuramoyl-L-alanine amidase [Clostridioides difficile]
MKIAIVPGHTLSGKGTGATGYIDEGKENRILTDLIVKWLKQGGATVYTGKVDKSNNYLAEQCQIANRQNVDVAIQIHFNADHTTLNKMGTETIYKTNNGKVYADRVNTKLATVFKNRGAKSDVRGLYWLSHTKAPAILIEVCFVDSKADTDYYIRHKDIVAKLIAEGILNKNINNEGVKQMYKHTIVYDGEVDKILANVLSWGYSPSKVLVCDIKDYVPGQTENLYVVGGGACEKISSITKEKFIMIKGNDRFDTLYKALDFINR